jgi:hypothetical protein
MALPLLKKQGDILSGEGVLKGFKIAIGDLFV